VSAGELARQKHSEFQTSSRRLANCSHFHVVG